MNTAAKQDQLSLVNEETSEAKAKKRRGRKGKERAETGEPKKRKRIIRLVVLLLLIFFVAGFLFASVRYDLFSVRTKFIAMVNRMNPEHVAVEAAQQQLLLDRQQLELDQIKLKNDRENLDARESLLTMREEQVETAEIARTPIHRRLITDAKREELERLGKIYNSMEAETAAGIITELYGVVDMATLLYFMNQPKAAAVLTYMDPQLAADITEELMWD